MIIGILFTLAILLAAICPPVSIALLLLMLGIGLWNVSRS
jgi:hypothetical protein